MENMNFVAIGKIVFETPGYTWNIPHTHFIVNKTSTGLFEATNLELVLDSIGSSIEESAKLLALLTATYIMEIILRRRGHKELAEVMDNDSMDDYWREYRKIEVELSETKNDISHNMDRLWVNVMKENPDYTALCDKLPQAATIGIELKKKEELEKLNKDNSFNKKTN